MFLIATMFLAASAQASPEAYGGERCGVAEGPETGVGLLCERALLAIEAKELTVARDLSTIASDLAPSHPGVWIVRAEVERFGRRIDLARKHFEKASELEPDNPAILVQMGDFEASEGNVRGAALLYERAAETDAFYPGLAERLDAVTDEPSSSEI